MPLDPISVICQDCSHPSRVTRTRWERLKRRMACGNCRKVTLWRAV